MYSKCYSSHVTVAINQNQGNGVFKKLQKYRIEIALLSIYYLILFPGRIGPDPSISIGLMHKGESTANWTALYFRILQIFTFNGKTIALFTLIGLCTFMGAIKYFIDSSPFSLHIQKIAFRFMCFFPIAPFFGLTLNHDVFAWSSNLITVGFLLRLLNRKESYPKFSNLIFLFILIGFLGTMSFIGTVSLIGLGVTLFLLKYRKDSIIAFSMIIFFQVLSLGLGVTPQEPGLKYLPFLGDMKCIAQDADSHISAKQWEFLESLGPRSEWTKQQTCMVADYAIFAYWNAGRVPIIEFANQWVKLVVQNPRLVILGRIQRVSPSLPPPFFRSQPNVTETDYDIPVGLGVKRSLQQIGGEVVIDAPIFGEFKSQQLPGISKLEPLLLLAAFLINQNSQFWGWGGLWLTLLAFVLFRKKPRLMFALIPCFFQMVFLFVFETVPDPRYVFGWIMMGMSITFAFLYESYKKHMSTLG